MRIMLTSHVEIVRDGWWRHGEFVIFVDVY